MGTVEEEESVKELRIVLSEVPKLQCLAQTRPDLKVGIQYDVLTALFSDIYAFSRWWRCYSLDLATITFPIRKHLLNGWLEPQQFSR